MTLQWPPAFDIFWSLHVHQKFQTKSYNNLLLLYFHLPDPRPSDRILFVPNTSLFANCFIKCPCGSNIFTLATYPPCSKLIMYLSKIRLTTYRIKNFRLYL